jgi:Tol biopolymer transport system component/predicted Ser/Thr protein kinase
MTLTGPERREQVERIYYQVHQLEPGSRESFLARMCAGDETLRKEIEFLLANHEQVDHFLETPALEVAARILAQDAALEPASNLAGCTLSHFRIGEKIGGGGMGTVYRAWDEHLHRDVAFKILKAGRLGNESARSRFKKEAFSLAKLNHPNIAAVYDFDTKDGIDFLVMEYVHGSTLTRKLSERPLSEKEIVRLAMQLADGLAAAQANNIVHRDLKPANLMVTADGRLKILDFGLATLARPAGSDEATASSDDPCKAWGTLHYMSPEQLSGEKADHRSDIYAVGTILYEIITGRLPFQASSTGAFITAVINRPPDPPGQLRPDISPRLEELVLKCLEKDPEDRYQSAKELLVDLRRQSEPRTKPKGLLESSHRIRPMPVFVGLGILAVLIVAGLLIYTSFPASLPESKSFQVTREKGLQFEPALSPDGNQIVYTSNAAGNLDLWLTDAHGNAAVPLTNDPADDSQPCWYPDSSAIAFTSTRGGTTGIWKVIPPLGGGEVPLIPNAEHAAISPDGNFIAYSRRITPDPYSRIGASSLVHPAEFRILTDDKAGIGDHENPVWSPDGKEICYSTRHGLWIVPLNGGRARPLTPDEEMDFDPAWRANSPYIYFSSFRGAILAIWRINPRGGRPEPVTAGTGSENHPSISRDGKRLAYATGGQFGQQYEVLLDRKTGKSTILSNQDWEFMSTITRDGRRFAFASTRSSEYLNLWIQDLDAGGTSGTPRRLTENKDQLSHPAFSPDGRWIAYYRIIGAVRNIWIIPSSGGEQIQFTNHPANDTQPAWSPNGSQLAFISDRDGGQHIWVAPVSEGKPAGQPRRVTMGSFRAFAPAWSPDGRQLAFTGETEGHSEVWVVSSDGKTAARQITRGKDVRRVRWDPVTGDVLASASWGNNQVMLWSVSKETGAGHLFSPKVEFGGMNALGLFELSGDGMFLVFSKTASATGNIWISQATRGAF